MDADEPRAIRLHPAAKKALAELPAQVRQNFEFGLTFAAEGFEPSQAKALKGFSGRRVLELRESDRSGNYRAVYTVKFSDRLYVLHVFQKRSKKGIATNKADIELVKTRLKWAEAEHAEWLAAMGSNG
jgi:phage-related protein